MYCEAYVRQKEMTILTPMLDIGANDLGVDVSPKHQRRLEVVHDKNEPTPPEALQMKEEDSLLETLLRESVTPEEHTLLCLIDALVDEAWRFKSGKALRGELRRMFREMGLSNRRFYAAFHGIEKRMCL